MHRVESIDRNCYCETIQRTWFSRLRPANSVRRERTIKKTVVKINVKIYAVIRFAMDFEFGILELELLTIPKPGILEL